MDAINLFEQLAENTWRRASICRKFNIHQGEETFTDNNLIELIAAELPNVRIVKTNTTTEAETGIDWEWWIGSNRQGWWRYAVQAKKLYHNGKYVELRHRVQGQWQIDILDRYASENSCIPLYCLYNFVNSSNLTTYWRCNLPLDVPQLGCTVIPIDLARASHESGAPKTFESVHSHPQWRALPWRCLVRCPVIKEAHLGYEHPLATAAYAHVSTVNTLPTFLIRDADNVNGRSDSLDVDELPGDFYSREVGVYPKRIVAIEIT